MISIRTAIQSHRTPIVEGEERFLSRRSVITVTCLFWAYVTLTDLVYNEGMRIGLSERSPAIMMFIPREQRVLQHLLMLPVLAACYLASVRIAWRPIGWRVPLQVLLALSFSLLMIWASLVAGWFFELIIPNFPMTPFGIFTKGDWAIWGSTTAIALLDYTFGLALIHGVAIYRRSHQLRLRNSDLQRDWASARLAALRSQLSPHTLFNALHTIQARINREPEVAQTLIASLGDLLRGLLRAGERDFTLLRDELQFVELYLGLQTSRFADRLTVVIQKSPDIPTVWVPSLILQPLVENAVVHGLADHSGPVRIDVTWDLSPTRLQLRVVNTVGASSAPGSGGVGLRNVRERLIVQFGERATFNSGPAEGSSWVATVNLPVLREWRPEVVPTGAVVQA